MRILQRLPLKALFSLVVLAVVAAAGYGAWYVAAPVPVSKLPAEVEIPRGSGFRAAVEQLERAGIVVHRHQFELLARLLGRERDVKAGNYQLLHAPTPLELLDKLTRGDVTQAEVRLIEGWTFSQFRAALDASADLRHDTKGLDDAQILQRLQASEPHPEGLFFPDTYLFSKGSSDLAVLRRAYRAMERHRAQEWEARDPGVPYRSAYEALIMASIIEKETGRAGERDQIGGVLVNRLRIGMRLQVDPTVIYGLGSAFDGNLKKIHLLEDGPYNTYTRAGLPPTPIAMPGLASLRSAMHPAKTDALYYVSRGDGSSQFSRNLDEHNRAVTKYQLKR
ncbi:MAG TPA: endolytic transglycosylase MltG [Burkholderiales bacterium]|nr:endolytic transglycosylase MltG [Burkholderiales bacterium]